MCYLYSYLFISVACRVIPNKGPPKGAFNRDGRLLQNAVLTGTSI